MEKEKQKKCTMKVADYVTRMVKEDSDLKEKMAKLNEFMTNKKSAFLGLPEVKRDLLGTQYKYMSGYEKVLRMRIELETEHLEEN